MQCERYLYLLKHKPKEKTPPSAETQIRFGKGRNFEGEFKATFPGGIDVVQEMNRDLWTQGASYTEAVFASKEPTTLFEACFIHQQTLVMTDVCQINEDGTYSVYEVKNSSSIKDVFMRDAAIQYYVCSQAQPQLEAFYLVLPNNENGFEITDVTEALKTRLVQMKDEIPRLLEVLNLPKAPKIPMGEQCHKPYDCEYIAYCSKNII